MIGENTDKRWPHVIATLHSLSIFNFAIFGEMTLFTSAKINLFHDKEKGKEQSNLTWLANSIYFAKEYGNLLL